jgi:hypothetical protein
MRPLPLKGEGWGGGQQLGVHLTLIFYQRCTRHQNAGAELNTPNFNSAHEVTPTPTLPFQGEGAHHRRRNQSETAGP